MGEIMENCWCFMNDAGVCRRVWAVCVKCSELRFERDDCWVQIVPNTYTFNELINILKKDKIIVTCKQGEHQIIIGRLWFAKKGMKEPRS